MTRKKAWIQLTVLIVLPLILIAYLVINILPMIIAFVSSTIGLGIFILVLILLFFYFRKIVRLIRFLAKAKK